MKLIDHVINLVTWLSLRKLLPECSLHTSHVNSNMGTSQEKLYQELGFGITQKQKMVKAYKLFLQTN